MSGVSVALAQSNAPWQANGLMAQRALDQVDMLAADNQFAWLYGDDVAADAGAHDWFVGNSKLVDQVLREVRTQLPEPNTPEAVADLNVLLSYGSISSMICSGQSVSSVVSKVCAMAQHIVDAAEERAAQRISASQASSKTTKREVRFKLDKRAGALGEEDLTEEDRALIEARLRKLHDLRDATLDTLQDLQMGYEDGAWRIALSGTGRFVMVPRESIRLADVIERMEAGKRFYEVTVSALPEVTGGALAFGVPKTTQRFGEGSRLVRELEGGEKNADGVAKKLMQLDAGTVLQHVNEEQQRLEAEAAMLRFRQSLEKPLPVQDVSEGGLCTFSPTSASAGMPVMKKPAIPALPALH